jgi:hypothetical protein
MEMQETIKLKGSVNIRLIGPDGVVKQEQTDHNLVVTVGKSYLASYLLPGNHNTGTEFAQFVALGTLQTGPASGDTALGAESVVAGYSRVAGTLSSAPNVWTNTATFAPGNGTDAIKEAGLFSLASVGTMFAHQTFNVFNKGAADTLIIVWSVTFS